MIDNTWKDRVIDERAELLKRYLRLRKFIDDNAGIYDIPEEKELQKEQLKIMADYLNVLEKRINRF